MQEIKFEFERVNVTVKYTKIPGKKELEDACRRFLIAVEEEKRRDKGKCIDIKKDTSHRPKYRSICIESDQIK